MPRHQEDAIAATVSIPLSGDAGPTVLELFAMLVVYTTLNSSESASLSRGQSGQSRTREVVNHQAATGLMAKTGRTYKSRAISVFESGRFDLVFIWRAGSG